MWAISFTRRGVELHPRGCGGRAGGTKAALSIPGSYSFLTRDRNTLLNAAFKHYWAFLVSRNRGAVVQTQDGPARQLRSYSQTTSSLAHLWQQGEEEPQTGKEMRPKTSAGRVRAGQRQHQPENLVSAHPSHSFGFTSGISKMRCAPLQQRTQCKYGVCGKDPGELMTH